MAMFHRFMAWLSAMFTKAGSSHAPGHPQGTPAGIEPPDPQIGDTREIKKDLDDDIERGSPVGIPQPGGPLRPLDAEDSAVSSFDAAMARLQSWTDSTALAVAARIAGAETYRAGLIADDTQLMDTIGQQQAELNRHRQGGLPAGHRFVVASQVMWLMLLAGLGLAVTDVVIQRPLVGSLFDVDKAAAYSWAVMIVAASTGLAYLCGGAWSQWLYSQQNQVIRRVQLGWMVTTTALSVGSILAITVLRSVTDHSESLAPAGVYLVVQAAVQALAMAEGFVRMDPRLKTLRNLEAEQRRCQAEHEALQTQMIDVDAEIAVLQGFDSAAYARRYAEDVAARYQQTVLLSRSVRHARLLQLGLRGSAETLELLPLPQFSVPDFFTTGPGQSDWLTGGFLLTVQ